MPDVLQQIQRRVDYINQHAAKAMNQGREWDTVADIVHNARTYRRMAESRAWSDEELKQFLELIEPGYQHIRRTLSRKRRPHPERSKRSFL